MLQRLGDLAPFVDPSAFVHEGAWVIGEVEVHAEASVWPGAVLRGDMGLIRVGAKSNIQDGAMCHNTGGLSQTLIGERVTVGHGAILHGCVIGDDCLIGMGSIILDNAQVGAGSLIGAGAVVTPGTVIPPGSVVFGSPGRVVKPAGPKEKIMIEAGYLAYIATMARYR